MAIKSQNCLRKNNRQLFVKSNDFNAEPTLVITPKISNNSSSCYSNSTTNTRTTSNSLCSGSDFTDIELSSKNCQNQQQIFASAKLRQRSSSSTRTPSISSFNTAPTCRIELINCDDIKIWTDQAYEQTQIPQSGFNRENSTTDPCTIPQGFEPFKQVIPNIIVHKYNKYKCKLSLTESEKCKPFRQFSMQSIQHSSHIYPLVHIQSK